MAVLDFVFGSAALDLHSIDRLAIDLAREDEPTGGVLDRLDEQGLVDLLELG